MTPAGGPAYVAAVLILYVDLPDTPLRPSPQDQVQPDPQITDPSSVHGPIFGGRVSK